MVPVKEGKFIYPCSIIRNHIAIWNLEFIIATNQKVFTIVHTITTFFANFTLFMSTYNGHYTNVISNQVPNLIDGTWVASWYSWSNHIRILTLQSSLGRVFPHPL